MSIHTKILKKESLGQLAYSPPHAPSSSPFSQLYGQKRQQEPRHAWLDEDAHREIDKECTTGYNSSAETHQSVLDSLGHRSGSQHRTSSYREYEHEAAPKPRLNAQTLFSFTVSFKSCLNFYRLMGRYHTQICIAMIIFRWSCRFPDLLKFKILIPASLALAATEVTSASAVSTRTLFSKTPRLLMALFII